MNQNEELQAVEAQLAAIDTEQMRLGGLIQPLQKQFAELAGSKLSA